MRKFGLIGHPIDHSRSPELFKKAYGGMFEYDLIEGSDFESVWKLFLEGYDGINITAPFKELACRRADVLSDECRRIGAANIAVKEDGHIKVYNSDYYAVLEILSKFEGRGFGRVAVIGFGGAGKAAREAAVDSGFEVAVLHHDGISGGVDADIVIYTLPCLVEGVEKISCKVLIESNYRDPALKGLQDRSGGFEYIGGEEWLIEQARKGYVLLTGEENNL